MTSQQIMAIIAPLALAAMMIPIFRYTARKLGKRKGWALGLAIYWLLWGLAFPLATIGWESISQLIQPQKLTAYTLLYVLIPILFVSLNRIFPNTSYEKSTKWAFWLLLVTALGNGCFEEVLWRGVYTQLFPNSILLGIVWPSLGFALWHYAPGSISQGDRVWRLMAGALLFGLFLGWVASTTGTIWWGILGHTLSAILVIL